MTAPGEIVLFVLFWLGAAALALIVCGVIREALFGPNVPFGWQKLSEDCYQRVDATFQVSRRNDTGKWGIWSAEALITSDGPLAATYDTHLETIEVIDTLYPQGGYKL